MYSLLCGQGWDLCILRSPTGCRYPPSGPGSTGGTRVYLPLCGSWWTMCILVLPRAVLIPHMARAGLEGLECIRHCVRVCGPCVFWVPTGHPYPPCGPGRSGGTQVYPPLCGSRRAVAYLVLSRGVPIPQYPRQDRRDLGASAAVWEWLDLVYPRSPTGRPYPQRGPGKTRGTRVYPPLCGSGWALCIPRSPTGRPYPPSGPGRTEGTRVYSSSCGRG